MWVALAAGIVLFFAAPQGNPSVAAAIYGASLVFLLGVSGTYHSTVWDPRAWLWMRRLDHVAIFVLIAGSYTPICMLAMSPDSATLWLTLAWTGAGIGTFQAMLWPGAPKLLKSAIYGGLSWMLAVAWPELSASLSSTELGLMLAGGLAYTVGAVVYATRIPDPAPHVFGYHEVFHALVILGAALQFSGLALLVVRS